MKKKKRRKNGKQKKEKIIIDAAFNKIKKNKERKINRKYK